MSNRTATAVFVMAIAGLAAPASAANKEHQQMMADLRMLQEQAQQLQLLLGSLGEAVKTVSARLDEQAAATRKAFADQKLSVDTLSSDLRVVREKVDDNNVRVASLAQELDALRHTVQQSAAAPAPPAAPFDPAAPGPPPGTTAPAPAAVGASPQRLYDMAYSDYTSGQYDLAIQGFDSYIRSFPKSDMADDAQVYIGTAYMMDNKYQQAVDAYEKAIRNYPAGNAIPEAYYRKGLALRHLGQVDRAREALEYVVKTYPDSDAGRLARQQLDQMGRR